MIRTILSILALIIGGGILFFWGKSDPQVFGSATGTDEVGLDFFRYAIAFVAMIAGIVLGGIFRTLQALQTEGTQRIESYWKLLVDVFRSVDFAMSVVAAPIIYVLLINTMDGVGTVGLLVVALQNGFFCNVIIQKLAENR